MASRGLLQSRHSSGAIMYRLASKLDDPRRRYDIGSTGMMIVH